MRAGAVSFEDLDALVAHQLDGNIDGLVSVGTTGESPTLTHKEHIEVVRATVAAAGGKVPVIAGTGSNSTDEAIDLTRQAEAARRGRLSDRCALLQQAQPGGPLPAFQQDCRVNREAYRALLNPLTLRD